MLADALERPLRFIIIAGQVGDITQAPALLDGQFGGAVLADKAYDGNVLRATITEMGAEAVIPSNRCRKVIIPHDVLSTSTATASSNASIASNTSDASQHATIAAPSTSQDSFNSPPP